MKSKRVAWILIVLIFTTYCYSEVRNTRLVGRVNILERRLNQESNARSHDVALIFTKVDELHRQFNESFDLLQASDIQDNGDEMCPSIGGNKQVQYVTPDDIKELENSINKLYRAFEDEKRINAKMRNTLPELREQLVKFNDKLLDVKSEFNLLETQLVVFKEENKMLREMFENVTEEMANRNKEMYEIYDTLVLNITHLQKEKLCTKVKTQLYTSCKDALDNGEKNSGVYRLLTKTSWRTVQVYCDQTTSGGGWMVFQRRVDGSKNFYRDWSDYKEGFGNLEREFWLGNELVHEITSGKKHELLIEIKAANGHLAHVSYGTFKLYSESNSYMIEVHEFSGENYYRNLRNKFKFGTRDKPDSFSCALSSESGWWFAPSECNAFPNMNMYFVNLTSYEGFDGLYGFLHFRNGKQVVSGVEMKTREKDI